MAVRVPALERGIDVLLFLASRPADAQSGSTVAQALGLSPAACHSLLSCLTEAGLIVRDSAKAYSLGPVLAALGSAAQSRQASDVNSEPARMALARELIDVLRHGVDFISAPIFSSDGAVHLALAVLLPSESFVGNGFAELTRELLAATSRVTAAIGGKTPALVGQGAQ